MYFSVQSFAVFFVQSFADLVQLEQGWTNIYTEKRFSFEEIGEKNE